MWEDPGLAERALETMMRGVSTRDYEQVLPKMAEAVGMKKSSVSRQFIEGSAEVLQELNERRWEQVELLVIYLDGIQFGKYHVIGAVGVDTAGRKHVLGIREGSSENATVATGLLNDLVERGVRSDRPYLFVIDGSKALRKAIDQVFGQEQKVQRCRSHKVRNVVDHLPEDLKDQTKKTMRAAFKLGEKDGKSRLEQYARWLETEHPSAAESLREGLDEMFTISRLGLTDSLQRCLGTTNLIESSHSGVRQKTRRVTRWQDGTMVMRWAAGAFSQTAKSYRKIQGHKDLWMLEVALGRNKEVKQPDKAAA
jgi:transposase-like protein